MTADVDVNGAPVRVSAHLPKQRTVWRTVRVFCPIDRSKDNDKFAQLDSFRDVVKQIARGHRIPISRTTVVWRTFATSGFYGYIRVYRGAGTSAEKRLFKRVLKTAASMTTKEPSQ